MSDERLDALLRALDMAEARAAELPVPTDVRGRSRRKKIRQLILDARELAVLMGAGDG